jgi:predicted nucleotidyltransferase
MIIHNILDELFLTRSHIVILRSLENYVVGISGREVGRISGISPKNVLISLSRLEDLGVVNRIRSKKGHLFSLNRDHYLIREVILPILHAERNFHATLAAEIKKALSKLTLSVYLFGSVAVLKERSESDYDVCIIYKDSLKKELIEEKVSELSSSLNKKYGIMLAPYYISDSEFIKKAANKRPPVTDIIREGKHISGKKIREIQNGKIINKKNRRPI